MDGDGIDRCSTLRRWKEKERQVEEEFVDHSDRFQSIRKDPNEEQPKDDQRGIDISRRNSEEDKNNESSKDSSSTQHQRLDYTDKETKNSDETSSLEVKLEKYSMENRVV
jgi:hypothetical protein